MILAKSEDPHMHSGQLTPAYNHGVIGPLNTRLHLDSKNSFQLPRRHQSLLHMETVTYPITLNHLIRNL